MSTTADETWATGDMTGLRIPADAATLRAGGVAWLTEAFRSSGALAADNEVVAITQFDAFDVGGTGAKLMLSVAYARPEGAPPADLFVKFSRNFHDPLRDRVRFYMEPEVRLARLSRVPGFPVTVPTCLFADFEHQDGTGVLITERVAYGRNGIEPHYGKCMDHILPDPLGHYRALFKAIARLAGSHKAGRLPADVADQFPFDLDKVLAGDRVPAPAERLAGKMARLQDFAAAYPQLFPAEIAAFLPQFAGEAKLFLEHEDAIKRFLHAEPDFIALCHWNANIDNGWYWRGADGELACGLMDWGAVGQMHIAMTLWGCLSGAETAVWDAHLDELLALFIAEFRAAGGPALDPDRLMTHLVLYVAMMGLASLLDAPPRIEREVADLATVRDRYDPRFLAYETPRVQLLILTNVIELWRTHDLGRILRSFEAGRAPA